MRICCTCTRQPTVLHARTFSGVGCREELCKHFLQCLLLLNLLGGQRLFHFHAFHDNALANRRASLESRNSGSKLKHVHGTKMGRGALQVQLTAGSRISVPASVVAQSTMPSDLKPAIFAAFKLRTITTSLPVLLHQQHRMRKAKGEDGEQNKRMARQHQHSQKQRSPSSCSAE